MKICLLTNQDLDADDYPAEDWPCDPRPYLPEDDWTLAYLPDKYSSVAKVKALIAEGFDLFFNLCDGALTQEDPGIEVVRTLEKHGVAFTGADSRFFEPSRQKMKRVCKKLGIACPASVVVRKEEDVEKVLRKLRFPMFVKHFNSYASVDLSRHSKVQSEAGLLRQVRKMLSRHGAALVEEYIEGVECTVLVAENPCNFRRPTTFVPIQYQFPDGEEFKHEDLKWVDFEGLKAIPVQDKRLENRLRQDAARFFLALDGTSYGRCDVRVDAEGTPYMLEMNPNCGIYYKPEDYGSADLCLSFDPAGHVGFTRQIVAAALRRQKRRP